MAGLLALSVCSRMPGGLGPDVGMWIQEWGICRPFEIVSILEVTFHTRKLLPDPKFIITSGPQTLLLFVALTDLST